MWSWEGKGQNEAREEARESLCQAWSTRVSYLVGLYRKIEEEQIKSLPLFTLTAVVTSCLRFWLSLLQSVLHVITRVFIREFSNLSRFSSQDQLTQLVHHSQLVYPLIAWLFCAFLTLILLTSSISTSIAIYCSSLPYAFPQLNRSFESIIFLKP